VPTCNACNVGNGYNSCSSACSNIAGFSGYGCGSIYEPGLGTSIYSVCGGSDYALSPTDCNGNYSGSGATFTNASYPYVCCCEPPREFL
jgi:hypothetical protein